MKTFLKNPFTRSLLIVIVFIILIPVFCAVHKYMSENIFIGQGYNMTMGIGLGLGSAAIDTVNAFTDLIEGDIV